MAKEPCKSPVDALVEEVVTASPTELPNVIARLVDEVSLEDFVRLDDHVIFFQALVSEYARLTGPCEPHGATATNVAVLLRQLLVFGNRSHLPCDDETNEAFVARCGSFETAFALPAFVARGIVSSVIVTCVHLTSPCSLVLHVIGGSSEEQEVAVDILSCLIEWNRPDVHHLIHNAGQEVRRAALKLRSILHAATRLWKKSRARPPFLSTRKTDSPTLD